MVIHNQTIRSIEVVTPRGCMGECAEYRIRMFRTGAFVYHGINNVPRMGQHKGSVNVYGFDGLAATVEIMGVLKEPAFENYGLTTVGDYEISIETDAGEKRFTRDGLHTPPMFATIITLADALLSNAKWGDSQFDEANSSFPETLKLAEGLGKLNRRGRTAILQQLTLSRVAAMSGMVAAGIAIFLHGLGDAAPWWIMCWIILILSFLVLQIPDRRML